MKKEKSVAVDGPVYYRLIALWVICEAVLGGMIHGLKLPISGLIVGSCAVICISLIAYYVPIRGAILKATIIVAIFKMLLSPHTPPAAYIAVFFQGAVGQLLFSNRKFFKASCILLGLLALVESALQRIIVLVVLYGNNFWNAVNQFISKISGDASVTNYSLAFAVGYVILHAVVGIGVGLLSIFIVKKTQHFSSIHTEYLIKDETDILLQPNRKRKNIKIIFIVCWIILLLLFLQSFLQIGDPILPAVDALHIFIRSLFILLSWYLLVNPLISYYFKKWLKGQQSKSEKHIAQVALLLPSTQYIFKKSWKLSASKKGLKRIAECCKIILINTLYKHA